MSGNTTDPGDRSSAEIEREVEGTRAQLAETLDALRESASPGQLVDKAARMVRDQCREVATVEECRERLGLVHT